MVPLSIFAHADTTLHSRVSIRIHTLNYTRTYIYIYMCVVIYLFMYIYIERERERDIVLWVMLYPHVTHITHVYRYTNISFKPRRYLQALTPHRGLDRLQRYRGVLGFAVDWRCWGAWVIWLGFSVSGLGFIRPQGFSTTSAQCLEFGGTFSQLVCAWPGGGWGSDSKCGMFNLSH